MEEQQIESRRDISEKWINNNIYEALETIEGHERRMINGCGDLLEYIKIMGLGPERLPEIQLKNMQMMIEEFDILTENAKGLMKKDDYNKAREKINLYFKIFNNGIIVKEINWKVSKVITNKINGSKNKRIVLTDLFNRLAKDLSKLRSEMVQNLSPVLHLKSEPKKTTEI